LCWLAEMGLAGAAAGACADDAGGVCASAATGKVARLANSKVNLLVTGMLLEKDLRCCCGKSSKMPSDVKNWEICDVIGVRRWTRLDRELGCESDIGRAFSSPWLSSSAA
jgi:hypothetical protein